MFNFKKRIRPIISKATNYVTIIFHDPLMYRYTSSIYQSKIWLSSYVAGIRIGSPLGGGGEPGLPPAPGRCEWGNLSVYCYLYNVPLNPLHVVSAIALIPTTLYPSMSQNQEMIECWRWLGVLYFFVRCRYIINKSTWVINLATKLTSTCSQWR